MGSADNIAFTVSYGMCCFFLIGYFGHSWCVNKTDGSSRRRSTRFFNTSLKTVAGLDKSNQFDQSIQRHLISITLFSFLGGEYFCLYWLANRKDGSWKRLSARSRWGISPRTVRSYARTTTMYKSSSSWKPFSETTIYGYCFFNTSFENCFRTW